MNKQAVVGSNFLSLLGLLFIGLKLTDNIDWSWWLVLSPFWIMPLIVLLIFISVVVADTISSLFDKR